MTVQFLRHRSHTACLREVRDQLGRTDARSLRITWRLQAQDESGMISHAGGTGISEALHLRNQSKN